MMWIIFPLILICLSQHIYATPSVTVRTKNGDVLGYETNLSRVFYGIPYAKPPIGPLRWNHPVPIKKWAPSKINATIIPPACPQPACDVQDILCPKVTSEDCLYLNIFTPLHKPSSRLPVMIFIPGGNFQYDSASIPVYNADRFVNTTDVVCVFVQYRLGILGFLATGNGSNELNGNYGILDQRIAIAWVKSNIDAFGGDPKKITLFGQSAGAQSTAVHYLTETMQPFFRAAIIESSPMGIPFRTYAEYTVPTTLLAQQLNCTTGDIACFRASSYQAIVAAQSIIDGQMTSSNFLQFFEPWVPVIDNVVVRGQLIDTIANTSFPLKPLIIGTMTEEGRSYVYGALPQALSPSLYPLAGTLLFGSKFPEIAQRYPVQGSGDQRPLLSQLVTEWVFACPTRIFARKAAAHLYVFGYPLNTTGIINAPVCDEHACHGYELPFLFQAFWADFSQTDRNVSRAIATYWTNYGKSKNPNRPVKVPLKWPKLSGRSQKYLYFDNPVRIRNNYLQSDCNFWDSIGYFSA